MAKRERRIERLVQECATEVGKWKPTEYKTLREARETNPGEYPNSFRIATGEPVRINLLSGYPVVHKTRFTELGYWMVEPGCWSVVDLTGDRPAQVGSKYATKAELLANLEAYATEYGCEGANPKTPVHPIDRAYEGQAHHMAKAAQSLVNMLNGLDYAIFHSGDAIRLTGDIHRLINDLERAGQQCPYTRPDGRVVRVTVPEREKKVTNENSLEGNIERQLGENAAPTHCPFCSGEIILKMEEQWTAISEDDDSAELTEYQCHGTCNRRSFWA